MNQFYVKRSLFSLAVLILLNIFLVRVYVDFQPGGIDRMQGDAYYYQGMAMDSHYTALNPYVFRILTPRIVGTLHDSWGIGYTAAWMGLTFVATVLMEWCFFLMLFRTLKFSTFVSLLTSIMLGLTYWFTLFNYQDIWLTDPLNNLFWVAAIWALIADRYALFFVIAAVGVLNKEIILILLPLAPLFMYMKGTKEKETRTGFWAAAAMMILLVLLFNHYKQGIISAVDPGRSINALAGSKSTVFENVTEMSKYFKDIYFPFRVFDFLWVVYFYVTYLVYQLYGWKNKVVVISAYVLPVLTVSCFFVSDIPRVFSLMAPIVFLVLGVYLHSVDAPKYRKSFLVTAVTYILLNLTWPVTYSATPTMSRDSIILINLLVLGWISTWAKETELTLPKKLVLGEI